MDEASIAREGRDRAASETPHDGAPADLARRLKNLSRARARNDARRAASESRDGFLRETYALPRLEARQKARDWFSRYPKAAYMTKVESWRQLEDGRIEFTMCRLPTAD